MLRKKGKGEGGYEWQEGGKKSRRGRGKGGLMGTRLLLHEREGGFPKRPKATDISSPFKPNANKNPLLRNGYVPNRIPCQIPNHIRGYVACLIVFSSPSSSSTAQGKERKRGGEPSLLLCLVHKGRATSRRRGRKEGVVKGFLLLLLGGKGTHTHVYTTYIRGVLF